MNDEINTRTKILSLYQVAKYRPLFTSGIICLSIIAALFEGIGLGFLLPIIELSRSSGAVENASGVLGLFVSVYDYFGVSLTLESAIGGVALVMIARYTASFLVTWLRAKLQTDYVRALQIQAFDNALDAEISYFDTEGSDDILNAIVTQAVYAGNTIEQIVRIVQQGFLSLMYLSVALYFAPVLTIGAAIVLGSLTIVIRGVFESGYAVGDRVADANERLQEAAQAGTQGIRDVKLFGMADELLKDFQQAADKYADSTIALNRNKAALNNIYQLFTALTVFTLIYAALTYAEMGLASLGVFLFAMFRLSPRVSTLSDYLYSLEGDLPHLVRTQSFTTDLEKQSEGNRGTEPVPNEISHIAFSEVSFSYNNDEQVLRNISFDVDRGEFIAFVGPSGAGKSTIVSLLARLYEPDDGDILANRTAIDRFDINKWRSQVAVVRQDPFIFNDTLRYNVTVGNRGASKAEIERACEIAQVTEFMDELPDGYDTILGDDGVRLSGGQRQRVSIARALLQDAEILILDEATSDLDSTLEEKVHRAIERMDRNQTMLVVAHRLSTVMNADRIYTMSDGQIEEAGTHEELVNDEGTYAELYATQTS